MNEEALNRLFILAENDGYKKSFEEFKVLMSSNEDAINTMYGLAKGDGYRKDINEFKTLVGFDQSLKKKEETLAPTGSDLEASGQPATGTPASESDLTSQPSEPFISRLPSVGSMSSLPSELKDKVKETLPDGSYKTPEEKTQLPAKGKLDPNAPSEPLDKSQYYLNQGDKKDYTLNDILSAEKAGMSVEEYTAKAGFTPTVDELTTNEQYEKFLKERSEFRENYIKEGYIDEIVKTGVSREEAEKNLTKLALNNSIIDPEGEGIKTDPVQSLKDIDRDEILAYRQKLADQYLSDNAKDLGKKAFDIMLENRDGDVESTQEAFAQGMDDLGLMFLSDSQKQVKDLKESIYRLESFENLPEDKKILLEKGKAELKRFIDQGLVGSGDLFNPKTGQFVSGNTKDQEVIAFNKKINEKAAKYDKSDLGELKKERDNAYFKFEKFVDEALDNSLKLPGLVGAQREIWAKRFGLTTPTDEQGINATFTKEQAMQIIKSQADNPFNFGGFDLANSSISEAMAIMNSEVLGSDVTRKAEDLLGEYMALNKHISLNEDPGTIKKNEGFGGMNPTLLGMNLISEDFGIGFQKGLKEGFGGKSMSNLDQSRSAINTIQSMGYDMTDDQKQVLETTMMENVAFGVGYAVPIMAELGATSMVTGGAGNILKIPQLIKKISGGSKALEKALKFGYGMQMQGLNYELAGQGYVGGVGEFLGESAGEGLIKMLGSNNKLLKALSKVFIGAAGETMAEYSGELAQRLSEDGGSFYDNLQKTIGTPETAGEKIAETYLVSLMMAGTMGATGMNAEFRRDAENTRLELEREAENSEYIKKVLDKTKGLESNLRVMAEAEKRIRERDGLEPDAEISEKDLMSEVSTIMNEGNKKINDVISSSISDVLNGDKSLADAFDEASKTTGADLIIEEQFGKLETEADKKAAMLLMAYNADAKTKSNPEFVNWYKATEKELSGLENKSEIVEAALAVQEQDNINQQKQTDDVQEQQTKDVEVGSGQEKMQEPDVEQEQEKEVGITPENSSNYANMTEDGEGNFVFYHVGGDGYESIKPSSGKGATSKTEKAALSKVGGLAMYYTAEERGVKDQTSASGTTYAVKIPKDKVYDANTDPLNLEEEARKRHAEEHPGKAFDANTSNAYITKIAGERGFDMVVSQWNNTTRAQTTKELSPSDMMIVDRYNKVEKGFDNRYRSNKSKGFESIIPESKQDRLQSVYEKANKERNKQGVYDSLYHLYSQPLSSRPDQDSITEMIEGSDISEELKQEYRDALAYEPSKRRSKLKVEEVKTDPVSIENSPKGTFVNIGMIKGTSGSEMTSEEILSALPNDVEILQSSRLEIGENVEEPTLSLELSRPLTDGEMKSLRDKTEQLAVPQISDGKGVMYGTLDWGDFNPEYFVMPNKSKLSESAQAETETTSDSKLETKETFEVADDVIPEATEGALSLLDAFGKKPKKSKVTPKKRKQVLDQVAKAEKALSKISTNTKIVVHETSKDYKSSGRNRNQNEESVYEIDAEGNGTIHINLEAANERTVAHEVFHALLLSKGMGDKQAQAITNKMLDAVKKSASPELLLELEEFSKKYVLEDENGNPILDKNGNTIPDPVQSEESIAELFGILASEYETLPRPTQNIIKRWLDKLAKLFGLKLFTDNEVIDMLNTVSRSVREGSVIEESDIDVIRRDPMLARDTRADFLGGIPVDELTDADLDQNQTRQWDREQKPLRRLQSNFSDAVSKLTFSYDKNSDRFDKLKKEGYITDGKSISDFDGKFFFFHQPDAAFSGQILKDGELLVEGKGGMYYPIKFHEDGYFWASTDRVAKKMADDLNKVMEQNGGKIYMALTSAPRSKLMSSTTMSNAVMDFFSSKSFDSNFNISEAQVKRSIVRAANNVKTVNGKKVGLNMSLSVKDSLSEIKSSVSEKLDPKKSSFKDRKSFVEDLVGEMSREINKKDISIEQFGKFFSEGIQNKYFKGVTKTGKVKVSKANMIQALSEMMTEPILKDDISRESGGQIYAVLEMEGKVKPVKSDKHESYPMAIQSAEDKKTTLHILSDRVDWGDVTEDFETNEIVKPERRKKIYPTSGVSTRGLKINTKSVRRRKQKPSDDRPSIEAVREKAKELGVSEKDIYIALKKMGYTNAEIRSTEAKSIADAKEKYNISINRGSSKEQALKSAVGDLKSTYWYRNASDIQGDKAVKKLISELGVKEKKAPSVKKILGEPKEKKVTVNERVALKDQIKLEAKAAREAVKSYKDASKDLIDHIKELSKTGVIRSSQASVMIKKVLGTNMLNKKAVDKMISYIDKVYSNAELAAMIQAARKLSVTSKKNLRGKVGPSKSMQSVLENLFSLDPTMVPMDVFDTYVDLLNQFGKRKAVLDLEESSVVLDKATKVLDSVEESIKETEISETGETEISETDGTTSNEEEVDFDKYAEDVLSEEISMDNLDSKEAKDLAAYLNKLTKKDVEALVIEKKDGSKSYAMLENLRGVKKNMTNGFVPSVALRIKTMVESKKSADKIKSVVESKVKNLNPLTMMSRGYGIIKGKLTGKRSMTESVRGNSVFSIDDILGNFNDKSIYNNTFRKLATAYSSYQTDMEINVKSKLDAAEKLLHKKNKFFQKLENKVQESKYKLQAYRLQREFESNPESSQVVPAVDFINETIRVIKKDKAGTTLNKNDIRILEKIKEDFGTDGQIDLEKIEKSMTPNEKKALKLIDEASDLQSKALWTSAVIRGEKIKPINNYVHHNVKTDSDAETVIEKAKGIMNPSTKAGTLNTRTPGVKAINFDPISSTEMGARQTLLDYHMTESVREVSSTLSQLQKMDYNTDTQQEAINAIDNTVRELLEATLNSQLANTSIFDKGLAKIKKLGYQASLASIPRAAAELGSNLMYAITKPKQFVGGVKEFGRFSIGSRGIEAMNNLGSSETMRLYDTHNLTGKMIDSGVLETGARKTTKTRSEIEDKIRYLDNLGSKQVRRLATTVADALISTPDKSVSRPMWFGTFASEFKKLTGETISSKEMDKIADGTSKYLDPKYNESVNEAVKVADREVTKMSNTNNPFNSTPKNLPNAADSTLKTIYKSANSYMASFMLNEFATARNAVLSLFEKGDMTKGQAAAALTGIQMRMASYMVMYSLATGLFDSMFGAEEEEKDTLDLIKRQMLGAPISLITGRSLGNIPRMPINYAIEQFNEEYLEGLRSGEEYNPYKHSLVFSQISEDDLSKKSPEELTIKMFAGPYSPLMSSISRAITVYKRAESSKKEETRKKYEDEWDYRVRLEALGNLGYIPFYKDIRRIMLKNMFKDKKKK